MNDKTKWNTIVIEIPKDMIIEDKKGKLKIKHPLTKTKNIASSNKQKSIILKEENIAEPKIVNKGYTQEHYNTTIDKTKAVLSQKKKTKKDNEIVKNYVSKIKDKKKHNQLLGNDLTTLFIVNENINKDIEYKLENYIEPISDKYYKLFINSQKGKEKISFQINSIKELRKEAFKKDKSFILNLWQYMETTYDNFRETLISVLKDNKINTNDDIYYENKTKDIDIIEFKDIIYITIIKIYNYLGTIWQNLGFSSEPILSYEYYTVQRKASSKLKTDASMFFIERGKDYGKFSQSMVNPKGWFINKPETSK